jgi:hypothetical protein
MLSFLLTTDIRIAITGRLIGSLYLGPITTMLWEKGDRKGEKGKEKGKGN